MSRRQIVRAEFDKDHGNCYYCDAKYQRPEAWLQHLRKVHPDTIRLAVVEEVLANHP